MRMMLQRLLRVVPLALMFASVASAQTTGNIIGVVTDAQSGKPIVGALVVATSPASQGEQTAVTDKAGGFRFQLLPPGDYKLATSFDGFKPAERADLTVRIDKTIRANLSMVPDAVQMEEQVVRTGLAPVINVGSAEAGSVVSREFLSNVPVTRGFEGVAITAPTAQVDRYGISFAGSTSPENGYLIDGMNVGDAAYGTLGTLVLTNFVQEMDIKTGSFMPEYGFSTGGIVSVVTKSGSNEFHGSVFANYDPGALRGTAPAIGRAGEALARQLTPEKNTYTADFGFEVGGPIIKDRLWFYAGFAPRLVSTSYERYQQYTTEDPANPGQAILGGDGLAQTTVISGSQQAYANKVTEYQLIGKLTYLFNENNQVALSVLAVPNTQTGYGGANAALSASAFDAVNNAVDVVGRYTSKLLNKKLQLELTAGYHQQTVQDNPVTTGAIDGAKTSLVQWTQRHSLSEFENLGSGAGSNCTVTASGFNPCPVVNYLSGGTGFIEDTKLSRLAGKVGLTYFAEAGGNHQIKGGVDIQQSTYDHTKGYTGPNGLDAGGDFLGGAILVERIRNIGASATQLPAGALSQALVDANEGYPRWFQETRRYGTVAATRLSMVDSPGGKINVVSETTNTAFYLQDSWQPSALDGLTINAGIRWELQSMGVPDQPAASSLDINNSIGPRIQAVYDWTRQGRSKVAVSWGRFFSSFPLDMADRAFGDERQGTAFRESCAGVQTALAGSNKDAIAGAPENCAVAQGFFSSTVFGRYTYVPTGAASTPVDPNINSPYVDQFGGSVEYELFADLSVGFDYQGRRQGYVIEDMSTDDGNTYFISNPGGGNADFTGPDGTLYNSNTAVGADPVTGRTFSTPFPKPVRSYDGFTFLVKKNFSSNWLAQASYTYSSLRGNYQGFFRETQLDPGITSMFDLASLLSNQTGPLPGDAPHSFKAYGSYAWDFGPKFSVNAGGGLRFTSGTPVNYLISHPLYGDNEGYGLPRGSAGRTDTVTNLDIRGGLSYTITPPYQIKFTVDVFNVLNAQTATSVDNGWTFDDTQAVINGQCSGRNAASKTNPVQAALADCPSLNYLKTTDGLPATINTNFARPTAYQLPLSVRFGLQLLF